MCMQGMRFEPIDILLQPNVPTICAAHTFISLWFYKILLIYIFNKYSPQYMVLYIFLFLYYLVIGHLGTDPTGPR